MTWTRGFVYEFRISVSSPLNLVSLKNLTRRVDQREYYNLPEITFVPKVKVFNAKSRVFNFDLAIWSRYDFRVVFKGGSLGLKLMT